MRCVQRESSAAVFGKWIRAVELLLGRKLHRKHDPIDNGDVDWQLQHSIVATRNNAPCRTAPAVPRHCYDQLLCRFQVHDTQCEFRTFAGAVRIVLLVQCHELQRLVWKRSFVVAKPANRAANRKAANSTAKQPRDRYATNSTAKQPNSTTSSNIHGEATDERPGSNPTTGDYNRDPVHTEAVFPTKPTTNSEAASGHSTIPFDNTTSRSDTNITDWCENCPGSLLPNYRCPRR